MNKSVYIATLSVWRDDKKCVVVCENSEKMTASFSMFHLSLKMWTQFICCHCWKMTSQFSTQKITPLKTRCHLQKDVIMTMCFSCVISADDTRRHDAFFLQTHSCLLPTYLVNWCHQNVFHKSLAFYHQLIMHIIADRSENSNAVMCCNMP